MSSGPLEVARSCTGENLSEEADEVDQGQRWRREKEEEERYRTDILHRDKHTHSTMS